jgi:hypothetical protein
VRLRSQAPSFCSQNPQNVVLGIGVTDDALIGIYRLDGFQGGNAPRVEAGYVVEGKFVVQQKAMESVSKRL